MEVVTGLRAVIGILWPSLREIGRESETYGHEVISVFAFRSDGTQDGIWAPDTTRGCLIGGGKEKAETCILLR